MFASRVDVSGCLSSDPVGVCVFNCSWQFLHACSRSLAPDPSRSVLLDEPRSDLPLFTWSEAGYKGLARHGGFPFRVSLAAKAGVV